MEDRKSGTWHTKWRCTETSSENLSLKHLYLMYILWLFEDLRNRQKRWVARGFKDVWSCLTSGENNVLNFIYLFCSMFVKYIFGYVQENGTSFLDKLWHRCHFETLSKTCLGFKKKRCVKGMKCWLQSTNKHCTGKKKNRAHPGPVSDANDAP